MIIQWSQHRIRPNAPQHVVLRRNIVKGYYSGQLVVESTESTGFRGFIVNVGRLGVR